MSPYHPFGPYGFGGQYPAQSWQAPPMSAPQPMMRPQPYGFGGQLPPSFGGMQMGGNTPPSMQPPMGTGGNAPPQMLAGNYFPQARPNRAHGGFGVAGDVAQGQNLLGQPRPNLWRMAR